LNTISDQVYQQWQIPSGAEIPQQILQGEAEFHQVLRQLVGASLMGETHEVKVGGVSRKYSTFHYPGQIDAPAIIFQEGWIDLNDSEVELYRYERVAVMARNIFIKRKKIVRVMQNMCYLNFDHRLVGQRSNLILLDGLVTFCRKPETYLLILDTKNRLVTRYQFSTLGKEIWCEPNIPLEERDLTMARLYREKHYDRYSWVYEKERGLYRDSHSPECRDKASLYKVARKLLTLL
jgi:hypothetical protein